EVIFEGTQVDWRDDNRHLWRFIEAGDEEDTLGDPPPSVADAEPEELPPRLYPEWDAAALAYRPDWVKVYDRLQPAGRAAEIDALLARHHDTERDLKRLLDALKPQDRVRLRHQEEGSELDLDRAIAAQADLRAGLLPDTRVQMSHRTDSRDIAVLLLMDLSASVNDPVPSGEGAVEPGETVLSLSRAAVALLAGAIATLGDQLAIVGFHSDTRQRVDLLHVKGFSEAWDDASKARLAAVQGAFSTRMGAALRHAGELLSGRRADRRLLLVLTDGRPSDVDVADPEHLVADAAQAVHELDAQGLYTHCISLDAQADAYVGRVFGARCSVIDRVAQLPRRLPEIFLGLTR
ncbi:MAG TPA: VWA domain-containing protein, partial [Burkholderiaceae bacterium]|nr:VWA domain-containing protein [Burkholderiaceae bacterium]